MLLKNNYEALRMDFKQGNPLPFFMTYPGYLGMGQERKALKVKDGTKSAASL